MHTNDWSRQTTEKAVLCYPPAGAVATTGKAIVHWVRCINSIKFPFVKYFILFKQAEGDRLLMSHVTMATLLLVPGFYTPNSDLWESHLQNFVPVGFIHTQLHQINPSLWERPNSEHKGKHALVLVT